MLRFMGTLPCFASFTKGTNFCVLLFAFQDEKALLKWGLLFNERICSILGANSFIKELTPIEKEAEITRPVSLQDRLPDRTFNIELNVLLRLSLTMLGLV